VRGKPFKEGNKGRPKGAVNHLTKTVKETVLAVFNDLQQDPKANLLQWGKDNPTPFYQIAAKLIPTEVNANMDVTGIKTLIIEPASNKGK